VRYFLDPFGCAKNQVDAEMMMARLERAGWIAADDAEDADLIIVNSCGFIEAAKRESINAVLAWRNRYPEKKILLTGCLAQRYGAELGAELTEVDGLLGSAELDQIAVKAAELGPPPAKGGPPSAGHPWPDISGGRPLLGFPGSAYVKISEGCDNRCSFCAIPLIRGPLRCRTIPGILAECRVLLERGIKELCLIGQDLASYKPGPSGEVPVETAGQSGLAALLRGIAALPGDFWVRLLYLHPDHFPLDILGILREDRRFLPYFDIPFQHASPPLLKTMGRRGGGGVYLRLLDTIRAQLPGAVIRSTLLAGFPGETEEDFAQLLAFQERARFDWLGVFAYSREEGTAAYSLKNRVSKKTAALRKALLEERQVPITEEGMDRFVGRTLEALIEEELPAPMGDQEGSPPRAPDQPSGGLWLGRLFCHAPEVDGAAVIGRKAPLLDGRPSGGPETPGTGPGPSLKPGTLVRGRVTARAGFDLRVEV
jgi:ribosomal protein S12 methylthiotransferase